MDELKQLTERLIQFTKDRDWEQFHNPKDLALSLTLEAAEVLEHFQWKSEEEIKEYVQSHKDEISEELADVLMYLLIMCHDLDIDIIKASKRKIEINDKKYPVDKAKGKATKYTQL